MAFFSYFILCHQLFLPYLLLTCQFFILGYEEWIPQDRSGGAFSLFFGMTEPGQAPLGVRSAPPCGVPVSK